MQHNSNIHSIQSIGIIGLGAFGALAASLIPKGIKVLGYDDNRDIKPPGEISLAPLEEVAAADVVIMAVPFSAYPKVLAFLQTHLRPSTLLIDVCSVKVRPAQLIRSYLPEHSQTLFSHPLFGPQSAAKGTSGHTLIVTEAKGKKAQNILRFCQENLQLTIHRMSPEAHDKVMAEIHALAFFVARGLGNLELEATPVMTPSYQMILDLVRFDAQESNELFATIQQGNPFAKDIRTRLLRSLRTIDNEL